MARHPDGSRLLAGKGTDVRHTIVVVLAACALALPPCALTVSGSPAGADGDTTGSVVLYRPPVEAPITDPFRAPATPYGPGNRGIEYATRPGTDATSIGVGVVTFAGPVAGRGVVSVVHPDGLRSSLTGLALVLVDVGQVVDASSVLGTTTSVLHLGVRRGSEYIDPATLFGSAPVAPTHAVLVPVPPTRRRRR